MTRIRVETSWPETTWYRVTFTYQDGTFTQQHLQAVNSAIPGLVAMFDGKNPAIISFSYTSDRYLSPARQAFEALRRAIPGAQFETRNTSLRSYLGNDKVDLLY